MNETLRRNAEENVSLKQNGCQAAAFRPCIRKCAKWKLPKGFRKKKMGIHRTKSSYFVQEPSLALLSGFTSTSIHLSIKSQNLPKENLFFSSFP